MDLVIRLSVTACSITAKVFEGDDTETSWEVILRPGCPPIVSQRDDEGVMAGIHTVELPVAVQNEIRRSLEEGAALFTQVRW
jgi:hypothetical protein